jgi:phosphohistidine phosphatase
MPRAWEKRWPGTWRPCPFVSPARRAQRTLKGLCSAWPALAAIAHTTEEDLYTFASDDLYHWIAQQDDNNAALFIIGHNPALTDLVNTLVGHLCLENLPTAGYVELTLPIERWCELSPGGAILEYSLSPKSLGQ